MTFLSQRRKHQSESYLQTYRILEEVDGSPRLKHSHKYYTQMQAQMWVTGTNHGYFIVWTKLHKPLYERVEFNREYFRVVLNNITLFYKTYTLPVLLKYRGMNQCSKCDKVILEEPEIIDMSVESSVCCDTCSTWWHLPCANLLEDAAESLETWMCHSCLVEVADSHSDSDRDFDHKPTTCTSCDIEMDVTDSITTTLDNAIQTCSSLHVLADPVVLCSVCSLQNILLVKDTFVPFVTNLFTHGAATRSSDLVCKLCHQ